MLRPRDRADDGRALLRSALRTLGLVAASLAVALAPRSTAAAEPEPLPPGPPAPPASNEPAPPSTPGDAAHDYKLRELEEKVVDLKEKVFRSKTRLMLLKERLLNDVIAEARVVIVHENEMGPSFTPVQVLYYLDGERIYYQDDSSKVLTDKDSIPIFDQNLSPGNHVLTVEMVYRGDSKVFSYLKDYDFKLRASHTFFATKGKVTTVRAIGYQKGDITWDLRERPSITFDVKQVSYTASTTPTTTDTPAPAPAPDPDATPRSDAPAGEDGAARRDAPAGDTEPEPAPEKVERP